MRTLVVSDLHLGSRTGVDVLRRPAALAAFVAFVREQAPDRIVLLGDALELRHGPVADALDAARPVFEALGAALGEGGRVVLVPGNHDHELVGPWLEERALDRAGPLGLEEHAGPHASPATRRIAEWLAPATLDVVYPGLWLREDVYATHGHFLDVHVAVPTFERLAAGLMFRVAGRIPEHDATPEDYEAVLAPLYAWVHGVARHTRSSFGAQRQRGTQDAWRILTASGRRPLKHRAIAAAFPVAIGVLNRLGLGPLAADVRPAALRRSGLAAMGQTARRLVPGAPYVLFGHTHRTGPLDGDDPAEWRAGTTRLVNTGSWVHEDVFLGDRPRSSPYWPGTVVVVDDDGPPRRLTVLEELPPA